ncbi:MAG: tyrosine-type recombinase/integrase [Nanoarchaeota archaeon]|nr:tyrosine-type recombinase/integrase [Nanoarchaeota archaeon]
MISKSSIPPEEFKKQQLHNRLTKIIDKSKLNYRQKETIISFYNTLRLGKKLNYVKDLKRASSKPISYKTFYLYVTTVIKFGEFIGKNFEKATKEDIELYQLKLQDTKSSITGIPLKFKTIEQYSVTLKIFYIWLYKSETMPKIVEDIEVSNKGIDPIKENEVLTPADVRSLIENTNKSRNKAVISLLFETGARVGELSNANIEDFLNYKRYAEIRLRGKTGERKIAVTDSIIYVEKWLNEHPDNLNPKAPLFTSDSYKSLTGRLTETGIGQIVKHIGKRVGIKKKYNPHWFRHSSADYYARRYHANERELRLRFGWTPKSPMPSRYLHYDEKEINLNYLKNKGIEVDNDTAEHDFVLEPKICTRCKELFPTDKSKWFHSPTSKYCTCGQVLDKSEIQNMEKLQEQANEFTKILLAQPITNEVDMKQGMEEAMFQTMLNNPLLLDKFKQILSENKLIE